MSATGEQRKLAAIMFTDMVGYSALSQRDHKLALELLQEHREILRKIFPEFNGTEIKTIGDAFLVEFNSALEAAQCAIEIQRAFAKRNADAPASRQIELKIGIHIGDVVHRDGDVYGDGVNIASRIESVAGAGGICVSMDVERQIRNAVETRFEKLAPIELKNISVAMDLFRIVLPWQKQSALARSSRTAPEARSNKGMWITAAIIILLLFIGIGWWWSVRPRKSFSARLEGETPATPENASAARTAGRAETRPSIPEKSIAVLPFENLSDDKSNAYFAEGIQDEILTRLSKVAALKVISRSSTQKYKSAPDNLREVGKQLGVANLLEGSVQKAGNAVHINVQLIKAATDEHLWAESYDRELQNIFGVEGEVAGAIADQLNAKLSGIEKRDLGERPTKNPDAYDAYLRGLAFASGVEDFRTALAKSVQEFEKAVQLDPEFAVAWAHLPRQYGLMFINNIDVTPERRDLARKALDMAMKFGPDLVETQLANGFYKYFFERDYEGAKVQFEAVRRQYPNNAVAAEYLGGMARRQGHWDKSAEFYTQAIELDPQNIFLLVDGAITDLARRDVATARKHLGRARDLSPENSTIMSFLAISFQLTGDIAQAQALLDSVHPKPGDSIYVGTATTNAILSRKYDSAIAMLKAQLEHAEALGTAVGSFENSLGDLRRHAGQLAEATVAYQKTKQTVNELLRTQPDNAEFLNELAWAETWLGDKSAAFMHIQRAIAAVPISKDALLGPAYEDTLARIEAHFDEKEKAIADVQHLLGISYASPVLTPALLRIDPDWDNLRGDPRFEKLCQER
jgi:TolB-like protein/class 3 adenylate cyclase/Tfp pilus assembly protein PilF